MAILTIEQIREAHRIKASLNEAILFLEDAQRMEMTPVTQHLVSVYQEKRDKLQRQFQEILPSVDETLDREGFTFSQIAKILDGEQNSLRCSANWAINRVNRISKKESED